VVDNLLTIDPDEDFVMGENVSVVLTADLMSVNGYALPSAELWNFSIATPGGVNNFTDTGQTLGNNDSSGVSMGDIDGDGDIDAFVTNLTGKGGSNKIWLNDGNGNYSDSAQSLGEGVSRGVFLADVDGDGDLDAFVVNSADRGGSNKVWLNDGNGNFSDSAQVLGDENSKAASLADLDGDGDLDAFVANASDRGGSNKIWLNDGNGNYTDSGQSLGNAESEGVYLGDLDGDSDLDAFVVNSADRGGSNKIWLNDGNGNFSDSGQSVGNSSSKAVFLADLDGDTDLDAFVANDSSKQASNKVWLNNGSGILTDSGQTLGSSDSSGVFLGDLDGDGDVDALVSNMGSPNKVWLNDGSATFSDSGIELGNEHSSAVFLADIDNDGDLDVFVTNANNEPNTVWTNINKPSIGDLVWYDYSKDGIQDPGEPGLPGVTVELYDSSKILVDVTTTDTNGIYSFSHLASENYSLQFVPPEAYLMSPQNQGIDDAIDSDADPNTGLTSPVYFGPGDNLVTFDVGMYDPLLLELTSFQAYSLNNQVILSWSTASEVDILGYNLLREPIRFKRLPHNQVVINPLLIPSIGNDVQGGNYKFVDNEVTVHRRYRYILQVVEISGVRRIIGTIEILTEK